MLKFLSLCLLLIPSTSFAEVVAIINAPNQVNIGDLVVLDSSESKGDNQIWIIDPRAAGRYLELEKKIVFAIGTPGVYQFQLIVADKEAAIDQVKHEVTVGTPPTVPNPPAPPVPPGPNPPQPPAQPTPVLEAVKAATKAVNDPETATAVRQALLSLPEKSPETVQAAISDVLLKRSPASQKKDWLELWRKPVNDAIEKANLPYPEVVNQIIKGLEFASSQSTKKLIVFTRPNCPPCDKWKSVEFPLIPQPEWAVEFVETTTKSTPSFQICTNGLCREFTGYMTYGALTSIVTSMNKAASQ